jgi:hypothetical protein
MFAQSGFLETIIFIFTRVRISNLTNRICLVTVEFLSMQSNKFYAFKNWDREIICLKSHSIYISLICHEMFVVVYSA